jgi:uncharacterized protein YcbX
VIAARDPDTGEKWPELLRHLSRRHRLLFGIFAAPRTAGRVRAGDQVEVGAGAVLSTNNSALAGPTRR